MWCNIKAIILNSIEVLLNNIQATKCRTPASATLSDFTNPSLTLKLSVYTKCLRAFTITSLYLSSFNKSFQPLCLNYKIVVNFRGVIFAFKKKIFLSKPVLVRYFLTFHLLKLPTAA